MVEPNGFPYAIGTLVSADPTSRGSVVSTHPLPYNVGEPLKVSQNGRNLLPFGPSARENETREKAFPGPGLRLFLFKIGQKLGPVDDVALVGTLGNLLSLIKGSDRKVDPPAIDADHFDLGPDDESDRGWSEVG